MKSIGSRKVKSEDRDNELPVKVGKIEERLGNLTNGLYLAALLLIAFLGWIGTQVIEQNSRLAKIEGELATVDWKSVKSIGLESRLSELSSQINRGENLNEIARTIDEARRQRIELRTELISGVGNRVVREAANPQFSQTAWYTALDIADYRTALNRKDLPNTSESKPLPNGPLRGKFFKMAVPSAMGPLSRILAGPQVPPQNAAFVTKVGEKPVFDKNTDTPLFVILDFPDGQVTLDGQHFKNFIFENARINYNGGPLILDNVIFVNCTLDVKYNSFGAGLVVAVLAQPSVTLTQTGPKNG